MSVCVASLFITRIQPYWTGTNPSPWSSYLNQLYLQGPCLQIRSQSEVLGGCGIWGTFQSSLGSLGTSLKSLGTVAAGAEMKTEALGSLLRYCTLDPSVVTEVSCTCAFGDVATVTETLSFRWNLN